MKSQIERQYKTNPTYGEHWLRGEREAGGRITIFVINSQGKPERLESACTVDAPDKQSVNFNALQKAIDLVNDGAEERQEALQRECRSLDYDWAT